MITISQKKDCNGCSACAHVCPKACITMEADAEGFKYPTVNTEFCIECGMCERACPVLRKSSNDDSPIAYAAINLNNDVREQSSSGGAFYLLAEYVLSNVGVVFGAKFDEDLKVVHGYALTVEEARAFMGSKYTQSDIGDSYRLAKTFLQEGRLVLFTGTPCQIGGLKAYLAKDYENLICQDIICHGVPSPSVWQKYVSFSQAKAGSEVSRAFFRNKTEGWKNFSMVLEFANGSKYEETHGNDPFMKSFLRNFCLRPSCYNCAFKSKTRDADITLADFWGVQRLLPDMDDDKGTSLIIIHSPKGKAIFESVKDKFKLKQIDLDLAIRYNSAMVRSVVMPPKRDHFMSKIRKAPFDKVVGRYCKNNPSLTSRIKRKIRSFLKK